MMDNERLIDTVEMRTSLYDKLHPHYSNRNFLNAQWREIGAELNCSDAEARKRWTHLRDYFQKLHREISLIKPGSGVTRKKWYLYDRLSFLIPHINERKADSNEHILEEDFISEADADDTLSHAGSFSFSSYKQNMDLETTESEAYHESKQTSQPNRPFPQDRKRKQTDSEIDQEMLRALKRLDNKEDEDELFFRSLIPKMRLLNTYQKMECQAEMIMLILKHIKLSARSAPGETVTQSKTASPS